MTAETSPTDHSLRRIAFSLLAGTLAIFAFGAAAGVTAGAVTKGLTLARLGIIGGFLGLAIGAVWLTWRLRRDAFTGPVGANEKLSRNLVLASGAIGGVLGLMLAIGGIQANDMTYLFGNAPITPVLGGLFLVVWFVAVPLISWLWWRVIDEHEAQSYSFGGMAALNVYYFVTLGWWIAWRSGFVPEPQHMSIFLVVTVVWTIGWMWRRYR